MPLSPRLNGTAQMTLSMHDARQHAEHFVEQIGAQQRGVAGCVIRRRDFYQIAADQVEALAAADDFNRLNGGQAADFRSAGAGSQAGSMPSISKLR